MVRLGVDKYLRRKFANQKMTEEQFVAETDKSPGVLLASGYIAGGALAGVAYAFLNLSEGITTRLNGFEDWSKANNIFYLGPNAGLLSLIPFAILAVVLYLVGREVIMKPKPFPTRTD
jgi:hypothetical protein